MQCNSIDSIDKIPRNSQKKVIQSSARVWKLFVSVIVKNVMKLLHEGGVDVVKDKLCNNWKQYVSLKRGPNHIHKFDFDSNGKKVTMI